MKKTTFISLFIIIISATYSQAQWGVGLHFPDVSWLNNQGYTENNEATGFYSPPGGSGVGIQGYYVFNPKMRANLIIDFIGTQTETTESDTFVQGQTLQSFVHITTPATIVHADFNYAITHDFIHRGLVFYALGGFSLNSYGYTTDFEVNYGGNTSSTPWQTRTYTGVSLNLGLGLEYAFSSRFRVYFDLRYATGDKTNFSTANLYNDDLLPNNFNPDYISSALGVRFNLFLPQDNAPQSQPEQQQQPGYRPYRHQN